MSSYYTIKHARFVQKLRDSGKSWNEIEVAFEDKFGEYKSHDTLRVSTKRLLGGPQGKLIAQEKPKILLYDIETAPMLGYVWGLWDNNIALNQLEKDWHIISWSAKWMGEDKVMYEDQRNAKVFEDETIIVKKLWKLLNQADVVITHNGKKFDQKKLNARFLALGLQPPGKRKHIDTLQIAKREFAFTSNKLEYLTDKFCVKNKKSTHAKFPGFKLWTECMKGNVEAWKEMEAYNRMDVVSLEELYLKLMPWDNTLDFNIFHDREEAFCSCGSTEFNKNGFSYTSTGKYQRFACRKCGKEMRGNTNLLTKEKRKSLRKRVT
jgi:DNA polymerase elongation subunit (family B)